MFNEREDLCSHGEIYLNVDGTIITQMSMDERGKKVFLYFFALKDLLKSKMPIEPLSGLYWHF
ncbi:hypothetical protein AT269_21360 [Bacillus cereus]|uniref:Uncharacterized protein n=1 Tax=Bacillus mycoides TaxID=1405 RepID=A0A5C1FZT8_BACMY|nr:hypothetical protein AT269_21360 [Bacillus cereus]QEL86753.1 hypothetical protein DN409_21100 [Bacillus mycoides]QWH02501.1 hypothetical protein EXW52_20890 [Bacillus mycoides]VXB32234.1 conserved hypothetical protein [Bacillus mycoides]